MDVTAQMDISPKTRILYSYRDAAPVNYVLLIAEGIDNAFDAGAREITVTFGDQEISLIDDGCGITRARLGAALTLGEHGGMPTSRIGKFGVGIKIQALRCGDTYEIDSVSSDGRVTAEINWREILHTGHWKIDPPQWGPAVVGGPTGTAITIGALRPGPRPPMVHLREEIASLFQPALAGGQRIIINRHELTPPAEPVLRDIVEIDLTFSGGRGAHLRTGIAEGNLPGRLRGVHVTFQHRTVMPHSTVGCGEYVGLTSLYARLVLSGPWRLGQFKDDLPDLVERAELETAVHDVLRPLLEQCQSATTSRRDMRILESVNAMLPAAIAARPKHLGKNTTTAKKRPKRLVPGVVQREKALASNSGPARTSKPSIMITFDGDPESDGIGRLDSSGRPWRVNLAKDEALIRDLRRRNDNRGIYFAAASIYIGSRPLEGDSFGVLVSQLLAVQDADDAAEEGKS